MPHWVGILFPEIWETHLQAVKLKNGMTQMKQKRWIKSVLETAKSKEVSATSLPWQRGGVRSAMIVKRHTDPKVARRA